VDDLIAGLLLRGFLPHNTIHSLYTSTSRFRRLAGTDHMGSLGAGSLTHFHLRSYLLGGSGIWIHVIRHLVSCIFTNFLSATNTHNLNSGEASGSRPRRNIAPTAKLLDPSNTEAPALSSHQAAVDAQRAAVAAALEGRFGSSTLAAIPDPVGSRTPSPGKRDAQAAALSSSSSEEEIGYRKKGKSKVQGQCH